MINLPCCEDDGVTQPPGTDARNGTCHTKPSAGGEPRLNGERSGPPTGLMSVVTTKPPGSAVGRRSGVSERPPADARALIARLMGQRLSLLWNRSVTSQQDYRDDAISLPFVFGEAGVSAFLLLPDL
jgi:hypothetical protein